MKSEFYKPGEDYFLTEYQPPKKTYDISQIGPKLREIKPHMKELLEKYGETQEFIEETRKLLIECIKEDDLPKALAIIDWVGGRTDNLSGDDLAIIHAKDDMPSIEDIAYLMKNGDFGFELSGHSKCLGLVSTDNE